MKEILLLLKCLLTGLVNLEKNQIFHSDLKLENIIYSGKDKSYKFIDFGMSKLLPAGVKEFEISNVFVGGTKSYFSPEIENYFAVNNISKSEEKKPSKVFNTFSPYKYDLWSLGKISERLGGNKIPLILAKMLKIEWRERPSAQDMLEIVKKEISKLGATHLKIDEEMFLERIEDKKLEIHGMEILSGYERAERPAECLKMAKKFQEKYLKKFGHVITKDYADILVKLGKKKILMI